MKIFEFAFNPKKRKDRFFEIFTYEPKSSKEKSKGSLYIAGELQNALEFNSRFLRKLSSLIQTEYYGSSLNGTAPALKVALKKANLFLQKEQKEGNVDWLGNLHIAILLFITTGEKKTIFHLAKTGNMSIHLARQETLSDVGKNLEAGSLKELGKVFSNLVSAKLVPGDSILLQNKEILEILSKEKSLQGLGSLKEAKQFQEFFKKRQRIFSLSSGILISFVVEEEEKIALPKPKLMLPKRVKFENPITKITLWINSSSVIRKRLILIIAFIFLLLLGYLVF